MTTTSVPEFPLFSHLEKENVFDYFQCHYRHPKSTSSKIGNAEYCGECYKDFTSMIRHQEQKHGIVLKSKNDYCLECQVVFYSKLVAIQHHIGHCLSFQHDKVLFEVDTGQTDIEPIFDKLKELRQSIINCQLNELVKLVTADDEMDVE